MALFGQDSFRKTLANEEPNWIFFDGRLFLRRWTCDNLVGRNVFVEAFSEYPPNWFTVSVPNPFVFWRFDLADLTGNS